MSRNDITNPKAARGQRLSIRLSVGQELLIRQAAEASDTTVTDFILGVVVDRAERVVVDRRRFVANEEQWAEFQALLNAPMEPTPKLRELLRRERPFSVCW